METREHFYADDPATGPVDAKTTLAGVQYFFLGNGLIQAAVQVSAAPGSTPAGLLIMDPERLGTKRSALTFDADSGLSPTQVKIVAGRNAFRPAAKSVRARWLPGNVPCVELAWRSGPFIVGELFFCPDGKSARLSRLVTVSRPAGAGPARISVATGAGKRSLRKSLILRGRKKRSVLFDYAIQRSPGSRGAGRRPQACPSVRVSASSVSAAPADFLRSAALEAEGYWSRTASCRFSEPGLDRLFSASKSGLRAAVARSGKLDGSIWQYNLEWVRDQAFVALALAMTGQFAPARTIFDRLLDEFISAEGAPMDSSRFRPWRESEFDQNGVLLSALESYIDWTGETGILSRHWEKIVKTAEFPLRRKFRHPASGLLTNRREFWERHGVHGILDGMELAHQLYVAMGLDSAGRLALRMGNDREARAWRKESERLKKAMLGPGRFSLVENGRIIKRREISGRVQTDIRPGVGSLLPVEAPLFEKGRHLLNPDTSAALPVAWEFIDPAGRLARRTLASLETLWNQRWTGGGYGRYHVTSEADSPGPWPFASLFVARADFEAGNDARVRRVLRWLERLPGAPAGAWFEFYGPRPVPPYPQVGVVPWVWAEMVFLFVHHMLGVRPAEKVLRLRPRLLAGQKSMQASLWIRGGRLELAVRRARRGERPGYRIGDDGEFRPYRKAGIEIPFPAAGRTVRVEEVLP